MSTPMEIIKPIPQQLDKKSIVFRRDTNVFKTIAQLESGKHVLIDSFYSDGLLLLSALKDYLTKKNPSTSFSGQRAHRQEYHRLSQQILLEVQSHQLTVKKAPSIGWLKKLYPSQPDFFLSFPQVQGLNSSWQWYANGITIPVLRNKVHPYYGVYFPTRFEHLEVFDNWLKRYEGPKKLAIDVGVGSGVLSLQLLKYGFQKVLATDTNPNAIVGLKEALGDTKLSRKMELDHASFFGRFKKQAELIVFNPPWLPVLETTIPGDEAMYYDMQLFPDFFEKSKQQLLPEGKLILLFSNLARITNLTKDHPIEVELAQHNRFQLERCYKKRVQRASNQTKRDQHWRGSEEVELWVLSHKEAL